MISNFKTFAGPGPPADWGGGAWGSEPVPTPAIEAVGAESPDVQTTVLLWTGCLSERDQDGLIRERWSEMQISREQRWSDRSEMVIPSLDHQSIRESELVMRARQSRDTERSMGANE